MHATQASVHSLFGTKVQYEVPLYQRRYVWEGINWETLWKDILNQENLGSVTNKGHFIGPIIIRSITGQEDRFEVIDGQQRLITFQIIFCVIRDVCKSLNLCKSKKNAETHVKNVDDDITIYKLHDPLGERPDPTYKFMPTNYDKSAFEKIVQGEYGEVISKAPTIEKARSQVFGKEKTNHNIVDAYDYFFTVIKELEEISNKIPNLLETIKNNLELVRITPGSSQQAEKIFESVNATGRKLSEFDYLRNNLFLRASEDTGEDIDSLYKKYWDFEEDPDYDWDNDTLESFFQAFLMAKLGPNILNNNAKLFDVYQRELVSPQRSLDDEFKDIKNYAEIYKRLDVDPKFEYRMQFYKELSTFYIYEDEESYNPVKESQYNYYTIVIRSFIIYLLKKLDRPENEILIVFKILESYVARALLVETVVGDYVYQTIKAFFSRLFFNQEEFTIENMVKYFVNRSKGKWIRNAVIKDWFSGKEHHNYLYGWLERAHRFSLRYIFYRIENWKRKEDEDSISFTEKEFPIDRYIVSTLVQLSHRQETWSFGNLTFCWQSNASRNSVRTLDDRIKFLQGDDNRKLKLNQEICKIHNCSKGWGIDQIKDRERRLLSTFCLIWQDSQEWIS